MAADRERLKDRVASRQERKRLAEQKKLRTVWFGLGTFGLVGWAVSLPTLLGIIVGVWLDRHFPMNGPSWTLTLLLAGVCLGCWNAWIWIEKESTRDD